MEKNSPLIGPLKRINKADKGFVFLYKFGVQSTGFWCFPGILEGLGSSGKLVGIISTFPGTSSTPWCRIIAQNPVSFRLQDVYKVANMELTSIQV